MKKYFASNFLGRLTKVILAIFLVYLGFSYFGILSAFLGESIVCGLIFLSIIIKKINFRIKEKIEFNKIIKNFAMPAFIASLAQLLFSNSQYILLTLIKSLEITGIFALAMLLTSLITTFPTILNSALFPIVSFLSANKENKKQAYLISLVTRYSIFLTLPIAFLLSIFSKEVILIISKEEYLAASNLFPILSISAIVLGIGNVFLSSLYAIGKTKINRNIVVLSSLSFLALSIPLTFFLSSIGMSIAYFFSSFILFSTSFFFIHKFLRTKFPAKDLLRCLISSLISFSILYFLVKFVTGIYDYILALMTCFLYLLILAILKFYSKDDLEILKIFAKKVKIIEKFVEFVEKF
jgi:O-antigen/teichoic acid export membrane protein